MNFTKISGGNQENYKNHLLIANFEMFNFEKLKDENENQEYDGILWKNGSYDKKNGIIKRDLEIQKDDIVYIYYTKLPDKIDRILIKCTVIETFESNPECFYYENNEEKNKIKNGDKPKIPAIKLKYETAINVQRNKETFAKEKLYSEYGLNNLQGKQHLKEDLEQKNEKNKKIDKYQYKLITDLNDAEPKPEKSYTLEKLKDYMNKISKCELEKSVRHTTFVKENGLNYYEAHHLIEQCNGKKEKFPKEIIDNKINIINLCPNCHKKIHNGKKEDREAMVEELYKRHEKEYNELLDKIEEVKQGKELDWLLKQYGVEK